MRTKPRATRRTVTVEELRAHLAKWEAAHPGFGKDNFPDAFRGEHGELIETDEFQDLCGWYSLLGMAERDD
jgi:hypothetical protein